MSATLNSELPRQILNLLSFVERKAENRMRRKRALFSFRCDGFLQPFGTAPLKYTLVIRAVLFETIAFRNLRLREKCTKCLRNESESYVDTQYQKKEIKNAASHFVSDVLSIFIRNNLKYHFNKVLICSLLLPQINYIMKRYEACRLFSI